MDLRASDEGDRRRGSTGKQVTKDAVLNGGATTGMALSDDEGNPSKDSPHVFLAPAREQLEASNQGGDLGARGRVAVVGSDDDDGGHPRMFVPSFSPLGCPRKRAGTTRAGFLEPATDVSMAR
jgi:hypothetical protein